eukprot:m.33477 g.33477  ORF g.33477 m.33477 type:complete len:85 (-) comp8544_c0_seq3:16-270(-)
MVELNHLPLNIDNYFSSNESSGSLWTESKTIVTGPSFTIFTDCSSIHKNLNRRQKMQCSVQTILNNNVSTYDNDNEIRLTNCIK